MTVNQYEAYAWGYALGIPLVFWTARNVGIRETEFLNIGTNLQNTLFSIPVLGAVFTHLYENALAIFGIIAILALLRLTKNPLSSLLGYAWKALRSLLTRWT